MSILKNGLNEQVSLFTKINLFIVFLFLTYGFWNHSGFTFEIEKSKYLRKVEEYRSKKEITFPDLNFKVNDLGKEWSIIPQKEVEPGYIIGFTKRDQSYRVMLNWFDHGVDPELSIEDARDNLVAVRDPRYKDFELSFRKTGYEEVDGFKGVYLHARYTKEKEVFEKVYWWTYHNGFDYTFLIKNDQPFESIEGAKKIFKEFSNKFQVINRDRFSPSHEEQKVSVYRSKKFHYSINFKYPGWKKWLDVNDQMDIADAGFIFTSTGALISLPYYFKEKGEDINNHLLIQTILKNLKHRLKNVDLQRIKKFSKNGVQIFQQDGSVKYHDSLYDLRLQLRSYKNYFYVFIVINQSKWKNRTLKAFKILEHIKINKSKLKQKIKFEKNDLERQGYFYNRLGIDLYEKKVYSKAEKFYKKAIEYFPKYTFVGNLIRAIADQGNIKKAYKVALKHREILKENKEYYLWIPFLLGRLDRNQEAIRIYEKVFEEGFYKYNDFRDYINLLKKTKKTAKANIKIRSMLKKHPSLELYQLLIDIYTSEKKYRQALNLIEEAKSELGDSQKLQEIQFKTLKQSSDLTGILKYAKELEKEGYAGFNIYFYRGYAWYHLNQLSKAKKSMENALEYDLENKEADQYLKEIEKIETKQIKTYHSKRYHYEIDFGKEKWYVQDSFREDYEYADASFLFGENAGLLAFSVDVVPKNIKIQDLAYSLVSLDSFNYTALQKNMSQNKEGALETIQGSYTQKNKDSEYLIEVHIKRYKNFAHLFLAWVNKAIESESSKVFSVLNRVHLKKDHIDKGSDPFRKDLEKYSLNEKSKNSHFYNYIGVKSYRRKNYVKAAHYFKEAFFWDKTSTILENLLDTYSKLSKNKTGYELIKKNPKLVDKSLSLLSWLAFLENEFGSETKSNSYYKKLFKEKYWNLSDFKYYMNLLVHIKQFKRAVHLTEQKIKEYPKDAIPLYIHLSYIHGEAGQPEKALNVLKKAKEIYGHQYDISYNIMTTYYDQKKYQVALKKLEELQKDDKDNFDLHYYRGLIYYKLNWYRKSKVAFEAALKKHPQDKNAKDYVEYLASLLGQGNNYSIKDEIKPVKPPKGIQLISKKEFSKKKAEEFGGYYESAYKIIQQEIGKPKKKTYYYKIKILSPQMANEYSSFQFDFDPVYEQIYTNKLIVRDSKERIISQGKVEDQYVLDKQDDEQATSEKKLNIPISGLEENTSLELMVTIQSLGNSKKIDYESTTFSRTLPMAKAALLFCGSIDRVIHKVQKVKAHRKIGNCLEWSKENINGYIQEPYQPDYEKYLPTIWLGDKRSDWKNLSDEYLKKLSKPLQITPEIRSTAKALTKGVKTDSEKIEKIFDYVQTKIKYKAIEFGTRGQIPFTGIETIKKKYGDCKDHSALILQLIRSIKMEAYLALINTKQPVVKEIPSLDQFDHMIVYIPKYKKNPFIDATSKFMFLGHGPPMNLSRRETLILKSKTSFFQRIKKYSANSSILSTNKEIKLEISKNRPTMFIEEVIHLSGYYGAWMRSYLNKYKKSEYKNTLQEMMNSVDPDASVKSVNVANLIEKKKQPIQIKIQYYIEDIQESGDRFSFPAIWETYYIERKKSTERKTPFEIYYPLQVKSENVVLKNSKLKLQYPEKKQNQFLGEHTKWRLKIKDSTERTQINYYFELSQGYYLPEKYSGFFTEVRNAYKTLQIPLKLN